jgi:uncharacterized coiled-coil protein SlyX
MDTGSIAQWVSLTIAMAGLAYTFATNSKKATTERLAKTEGKVEALEDKVARLDGEIGHLPDQAGMHRMELALSAMRGDLNVMTERMKAVASTGERLQEFLVDQAGKK